MHKPTRAKNEAFPLHSHLMSKPLESLLSCRNFCTDDIILRTTPREPLLDDLPALFLHVNLNIFEPGAPQEPIQTLDSRRPTDSASQCLGRFQLFWQDFLRSVHHIRDGDTPPRLQDPIYLTEDLRFVGREVNDAV